MQLNRPLSAAGLLQPCKLTLAKLQEKAFLVRLSITTVKALLSRVVTEAGTQNIG